MPLLLKIMWSLSGQTLSFSCVPQKNGVEIRSRDSKILLAVVNLVFLVTMICAKHFKTMALLQIEVMCLMNWHSIPSTTGSRFVRNWCKCKQPFFERIATCGKKWVYYRRWSEFWSAWRQRRTNKWFFPLSSALLVKPSTKIIWNFVRPSTEIRIVWCLIKLKPQKAHSSYSSDMTPLDKYLFSHLQLFLEGSIFSSSEKPFLRSIRFSNRDCDSSGKSALISWQNVGRKWLTWMAITILINFEFV